MQPLHNYLSGEGGRKKKQVSDAHGKALGAFKTPGKACPKTPVLAFADFNKQFLVETDASKLVLGAVLSQKQTDCHYHLVVYASLSLTVHEQNYHSTTLEVLALKWAMAGQFQEYLFWKPFGVKTDNHPLTYIMTTPNFDAAQHCWVESLVGFIFGIVYQLAWDSAVADALSQVTLRLDTNTVKSNQDKITMGKIGRVDAHDPVVVEADEEIPKQVWEIAVQARAIHA